MKKYTKEFIKMQAFAAFLLLMAIICFLFTSVLMSIVIALAAFASWYGGALLKDKDKYTDTYLRKRDFDISKIINDNNN